MKTKNYNPIKKQLIIVLMILSFMAGLFAQKSTVAFIEDSNFKYLKSLAIVMSNIENEYADLHIKPVGTENAKPVNIDLRFEEFKSMPDNATDGNFLYNDAEEKLQVEEWMMDEDHFIINNSENELFETAKEEKLVIEDWMLDESHFISGNNRLNEDENSEEELKIENWMLDLDHWVLRAD